MKRFVALMLLCSPILFYTSMPADAFAMERSKAEDERPVDEEIASKAGSMSGPSAKGKKSKQVEIGMKGSKGKAALKSGVGSGAAGQQGMGQPDSDTAGKTGVKSSR